MKKLVIHAEHWANSFFHAVCVIFVSSRGITLFEKILAGFFSLPGEAVGAWHADLLKEKNGLIFFGKSQFMIVCFAVLSYKFDMIPFYNYDVSQ